MRKALSIILCLCMVLSVYAIVPFSATAAENEITETGATSGMTSDCTWTLNGTELTISGNGAMADYESNSTLPWGVSITKVTITDGVINVGSYAFYKCSSLTSITIPDSVTSIGKYAFSWCSSLTNIKVSVNNSVYDSRDNCNAIVETKTNTLVTGCKNTIIPNSVTSIGSSAFYGCASLTSVTIPNSVTSIGGSAFSGCSNLTSVNIGNSVTSIGRNAFSGCSNLTSVTIPDSVTSIGDYAFRSCSSLTSITIPDSVTSIGDDAFFLCESLTSVTIPDSVTSIGDDAFSGCSSLTSVTIPDSVTSVGGSAFNNTAWYKNQPDGLVYAGKIAYKMKDTCPSEVVIKDGTLGISDKAFSGCNSLTSVTIPDSVLSIGDSAFSECTSLTSVTIPDSVTSIGDYAFFCCSSLTSVTIPDSVTSIGNYAFSHCNSLTEITIPDSVTNLGGGVFDECNNLISATIGDSVTTLGVQTFDKCKNLTTVVLGDSITSIDSDAFRECESLTSVSIPDSVTSIGDCAFSFCRSLTSVAFGNSVQNIGNSAFRSCNMTSLTIPDTVTTIGNEAFYGCAELTSLNLSKALTTIGNKAFYWCPNLTSVVTPKSLSSIGNMAFGYYYQTNEYNSIKLDGFTIYGYEGSSAENYAKTNGFSFVSYADIEDYEGKSIIFIDTTALSAILTNDSDIVCEMYDKEYAVKPVDENTWIVDFDKPIRQYDTTSDGEYHIASSLKSITIYGSIQSYPCYFDETCYGDTLVFDGESITKDNYWGEAYNIYFCHWKNHDNTIYGAITGFDDNYNLIGETTLNFNQRISLLRDYIECKLPEIRPTTIDTDQYLIDEKARQLGMKKADVACLIENTEIWNSDDSELPDGYSYDIDSYYLKEENAEKPLGYQEFLLDANTGLYALFARKPSVIDFNSDGSGSSSGSSSSSSSSSSSGSSGSDPNKPVHTFVPDSKYIVVRYDGEENFTTVCYDSITPYEGGFYFFRQDNFYCFGYNTLSEIGRSGGSSGGSSSSGHSSYYPLDTPAITSVTDSTDGLIIKWGAVTGAVKYRVFIKGNTDWIKIGDTAETSYLFSNAISGNSYTFTVQCISADGSEELSDYNDNTFGATKRHIDTPKVIKLQSLSEGNKITWNPVPGVARYRVSVKSRNSWKTLGDTFDTSFIHSSQGEGSIYAQQGVEYTYTVTCVSYTGYALISDYNHTGWSIIYTGDGSVVEDNHILGDVDGDGTVTILDATFVQRHLASIPIPFILNKTIADTDEDGIVAILDATYIQRWLANLKSNDNIGKPI